MFNMKQGYQYVLHGGRTYCIIYVRSKNETLRKLKMTLTKSERLVEALKTGEKLTAAQIKARFGIANPTASTVINQKIPKVVRLPSTV
jgi:Fic family protein